VQYCVVSSYIELSVPCLGLSWAGDISYWRAQSCSCRVVYCIVILGLEPGCSGLDNWPSQNIELPAKIQMQLMAKPH